MMDSLRTERPAVRRAGGEVTIARSRDDLYRCDGLANSYTEKTRVQARPPGGGASEYEAWENAGSAIAGNTRLEANETLLDRLHEYAVPNLDTNPTLARCIIEDCAKKMAKNPCDLCVADIGVGWGGQLLAACAAGVGEYHAYVPYQTPATALLVDGLKKAMAAHRPACAKENRYWVRTMEPAQARREQLYDIVFSSTANVYDLVSRAGAPGYAHYMVKPGGCVALFVGNTDIEYRRACVVADEKKLWVGGAGLSYRVHSPACPSTGAYVFTARGNRAGMFK
jgi:hypothetical protein